MHDGLFDEGYSYGIPEIEREVNFKKVFSPLTVIKHQKINNILNILFCIFVLFLCDFEIFQNWNIVKIGIAFVVFDFILGFIDNYIVNVKPYRNNAKLSDVSKRQNYVNKLEEKVEKLKEESNKYRKDICAKCSYRYWSDRNNKYTCDKSIEHQCDIFREFDWYKKELEYHKRILEKELKTIETEAVLKNEKVSSDYKDKLVYFKDMKVKFEHLAKTFKGLSAVVKSLNNLIVLLEKKPIGLTFVPNTVYIFLDELQTISSKLETLDKTQQDRYIEKFGKVAEALSENIEDINRRIDNYETEDIEIGLNVLFSELVKDTEGRKDV